MNKKIRVLNHSQKKIVIKRIFIEITNKKIPCVKSQSKIHIIKIFIEIMN